MLVYTKLWVLLEKRGMKRTDLKNVISSATLAKLGKNEPVSSTVIEKICNYLECQPGDIMENIKREDLEKTVETMNDTMQNMINTLMTATGKSKDEVITDFQKEIPNILEQIKAGKFIIPDFPEYEDNDEEHKDSDEN